MVLTSTQYSVPSPYLLFLPLNCALTRNQKGTASITQYPCPASAGLGVLLGESDSLPCANIGRLTLLCKALVAKGKTVSLQRFFRNTGSSACKQVPPTHFSLTQETKRLGPIGIPHIFLAHELKVALNLLLVHLLVQAPHAPDKFDLRGRTERNTCLGHANSLQFTVYDIKKQLGLATRTGQYPDFSNNPSTESRVDLSFHCCTKSSGTRYVPSDRGAMHLLRRLSNALFEMGSGGASAAVFSGISSSLLNLCSKFSTTLLAGDIKASPLTRQPLGGKQFLLRNSTLKTNCALAKDQKAVDCLFPVTRVEHQEGLELG